MDTITLDKLNAASEGEFVAALGDIFEHTPGIARAAYAKRPFASLAALNDAMQQVVLSQSKDEQLALLRVHPDLAGKAARAGVMTADSKAEQSSVGLDRLTEEEFARFHTLNSAYHEKFGIPFIVCVRRHARDSIMREFERRLKNSVAQEQDAALKEVFRIVALRLDQRIAAPDKLKVHGRISTHILDTQTGKPAPGVAIELLRLSASGETQLVTRTETNADGRTDKPLIGGQPVPIATYELRFAVGPYFAANATGLADPPFLDVIPLRFSVAEPEAHYHVPLLVTPWSYSTYRGS